MIRDVVAAMLAAWLLISPAHAGPIQLSDFSSRHIEVSLASLPVGMGSVPSITADGITFQSGGGGIYGYPTFPPWPGGPSVQVCAELGCILTNSDLDSIFVDLPSPVAKVGALLGIPNMASTARAEFYSNATLLGTVDISADAFEGIFAGWDAGASVITRVRFVDTVDQGFVLGMSRFTYEFAATVPEPSTAMLLLLGGVCISGFRRRSQPLRHERLHAGPRRAVASA
jgi:hypothetical protein